MRIIFTLLMALALSTTALAQQNSNYWKEISEQQMLVAPNPEAPLPVLSYKTFELDIQALRQALRQAPMEFTAAARTAPATITLPMPDGTTRTMAVVESPVMHPDLAAKYPQIKSFKVWDTHAPQFSGRIDYSPLGFNAIFESAAGEIFITPYDGQTVYHAVYHTKAIDFSNDPPLSCGLELSGETVEPTESELMELEQENALRSRIGSGRSGEPQDLRVYDLALTCTGEFGQALGNGNVEDVLARFNSAANIVNQSYENELAIRFQLIADIENIIFTDPLTDPFSSSENTSLIFQNVENAIVEAGNIPFDAYDIGHVFTMSCFNPGGEFSIGGIAVLNSICQDTKSLGITCFPSNPNAFFGRVRGTMTHEVGHQFSAQHTFSNCPGALTALSSGSAYEPGSGSTIMSYSGSCGNQNVIVISDNYFHVKSLDDIMYFSREDSGSTCPTLVPTNNTIPTIELAYEDGFYIPISTPFELTANVTDMEDDPLTYCWEQFNLGPVSDLGSPFGDAPIFQSFPPNPSPSRVFPRYSMLLNNDEDQYEVLPTYSRNLKFRCTVRDNNTEAGAAVWEEVSFQATNTAGPFLVQGPNTGNEEWEAGDYVEVSWDVANTTNSLVDCQFVNIKLSVDGGFTYPYTLAANTQNDGSEFVTVPDITSNLARIRVEAANNIFFDVSNANFDIVPATEPGFALTATPSFQQVCLPQSSVIVDLSTFGLLDFNNPIQFEILDGLPVGAVANISVNDILPSESSALEIDMSDVTAEGLYEVTIRAIATDADTTFRTLFFDVYSNDFSTLELNTPPDGQDGIILSTDFDWIPSDNAITYDFQVATDASFAPGTIVDSGSGLTNPDFALSVLLEENDIFYWRVRRSTNVGLVHGKKRIPFTPPQSIVLNMKRRMYRLPSPAPASRKLNPLFLYRRVASSMMSIFR
jgi:predicted Zn-dependent protease